MGGFDPPKGLRRNTVLIKTQDKFDAASAILEMLLQDPRKYCNMCGSDYLKGKKTTCCEHPQVGSHYEHLMAVVKQNKMRQTENSNSYGSGEETNLRGTLAMPPILFNEWCFIFQKRFGEKLLGNHNDMIKMMKRFPYLRTCERV